MTTRRNFIRSGCRLSGVLWFGSSAIAALAPSSAWAIDLSHFDESQSRILLSLIRHIFPHDNLDDAVYALVVKDLDSACSSDSELARLLDDGVAELNLGGNWQTASTAQQLKLVENIAGSAFFNKLRSTAVVSLYNNELAFAHFGYAGSSFEKGGYLNRGFDDLTWLPNPPPNVSPPPG